MNARFRTLDQVNVREERRVVSNSERVQVTVQPPHSGVEGLVEIGQTQIVPHADTPPNDWLYPKKFNPEHDISRI